MIKVLCNAEVYTPEYLGFKDIIITADKIFEIRNPKPTNEYKNNLFLKESDIFDMTGCIMVPGFIDNHVHILGGGGEGGYKKRTPEIKLTDIISGGITTVIGLLGTDGIGRDMKALVCKANALEEEGISTFILTGSYDIPVKTITGSIEEDIMMIDKIIGVGEIAISDHRSSQPSYDDFIKVVAVARRGGILSGKAGVTDVHIGDGSNRLIYLKRMAEETEIPVKQVIPTHINRTKTVLEAGLEFAKLGGYVDMTTSSDPDFLEEDEVKASHAIKFMLDNNIKPEQILCSSDGQGSMPIFNKKGELTGVGICKCSSLYREVRDAVLNDAVKFEHAIMTITSNPADAYKLSNKGKIKEGFDADLIILNKDNLLINDVLAKGKFVVKNCKNIIQGTFE